MTERIDAHQHYWHPGRGDYFWLSPDSVLNRPFGPADMEPLLAEAGFQGTVLVQAAPTVEETEYMLGIADATDSVRAVVGWVDFTDPAHRAHLERLARHPKFRGVRPMIQDIADVDWMLRPDIEWAFRALIDLDLTFDALTHPRHLSNLRRLLARWPDLRVVIDHASKPAIRNRAFDGWAADMAALAADTGAWCKFSGLVTEAATGWTVDDLRPYADHLLGTFGAGRLIFGSDWPVCTLAATYLQWVDAAEELVGSCSAGEKIAIFGANATQFYRLPV
ncbi:amidohydrolase family protein [Alsobacter sp. R-9]